MSLVSINKIDNIINYISCYYFEKSLDDILSCLVVVDLVFGTNLHPYYSMRATMLVLHSTLISGVGSAKKTRSAEPLDDAPIVLRYSISHDEVLFFSCF
jgi:hypothetical protein